jgi:hypothetical protein
MSAFDIREDPPLSSDPPVTAAICPVRSAGVTTATRDFGRYGKLRRLASSF